MIVIRMPQKSVIAGLTRNLIKKRLVLNRLRGKPAMRSIDLAQ